jgi:hypothetical protein
MTKETKYDVYQHGHEIPIMTNATLEQDEKKSSFGA